MFAFHKKEVLLSSSKDLIQGHAAQQRVCFSMCDDPELVSPLSPPTLSSKWIKAIQRSKKDFLADWN